MIDEEVKALAQAKNYATLTTMLPGGQPMTHVMWIDADDDHVLINTETHRQKYKNVQLDPRVTVAIIDMANPYHYAEVRGRVVGEVTGPAARAHIDELSQKYLDTPYGAPITSERVILQIAPERQRVQ
ncbi:MAG TPA: TIGR03618 family F420-dependent PPOX class oxidoreductase [Acidimicrobiales bacterium]|jgi:PPOX class probable F420-dependent enzyme|nr:TIGR03618 family F420-dependent PPOX class oxidoreductase [Acidimicrobiales bacterium]